MRLSRAWAAWGLLSAVCFAGAAQEDSPAAKALGRRWAAIETPQPGLGVRELFGFALDAAAVGWHPERIAKAFDLAEQAQDRDPKSRTYGNFKWYWRDTRPADLNAVEFSMQQGVLVWMLQKDKLDADGVERLERLLRFGVEGIRRHRVREDYTNIFLMKTWNAIAIGEATNQPALADEGYAMLDRWLLYTYENGVHEYVSPTYYGVDLDSLGLMARFAKREQGRKEAEAALRLFWTDIAANWFEPCQRLGGAHSRDYDYLTGHGYLDQHLRMQGWIASPTPFQPSAFLELCRWDPPGELRQPPVGALPRTVHQRFGPNPWERATHYVGRRFSLGSAGHDYEPTGKPLTVNLAGGPRMAAVNFLMDARRDPYGTNRFVTGGGHRKALHLLPFLMSVQRGAEVLFLASIDPASPGFRRWAPEPACLLSHLVIPSNVEVWVGEGVAQPPAAGSQTEVPRGQAVFLRFQDVAVGVRFVLALDTAGQPAPVALANDGRPGAMRLTCTHSATAPKGRGTVALWVRAAEGLDDVGFARFRAGFASAAAEARVEGSRIEVAVPGAEGRLRLACDVAKGERLACEGAEPGSEAHILSVNGRDFGREILGPVAPKCSAAPSPRAGKPTAR